MTISGRSWTQPWCENNRSTENIFYPLTSLDLVTFTELRSVQETLTITIYSHKKSESRELKVKNSLYFSSRLLDLSIFGTVDIYNIKPFKPAVDIYFVRHNK